MERIWFVHWFGATKHPGYVHINISYSFHEFSYSSFRYEFHIQTKQNVVYFDAMYLNLVRFRSFTPCVIFDHDVLIVHFIVIYSALILISVVCYVD